MGSREERLISTATSDDQGEDERMNFTSSGVDQFLRDNGINVDEEEESSDVQSENIPREERTQPLRIQDLSSSDDESIEAPNLFDSVSSINEMASISSISISNSSRGWDHLNAKLQENGFSSLNLDPEGRRPNDEGLMNCINDILVQFSQRGKVIQDLVVNSDVQSRQSDRTETSLQHEERKGENLKGALNKARFEAKELEEQVTKLQRQLNLEKRKAKQEKSALQMQLKQSEHRVKTKEIQLNRLQEKLQQQVRKEHATQQRDKEVFRKLQGPSPSKKTKPDLQQVIRLYENQRERMESEIRQLKAQVGSLSVEIKDKENFNDTSEYQNELLQRLKNARTEQEEATSQLRNREALIMKKLKKIQQELQISRETNQEMAEENANLQLEVKSRPSVHAYRTVQKRLEKTELQLAQHQQALAEASDVAELRKLMDTKTMIQKDRQNHQLHLNRLQAVPKSVLLEIVQQVCRLLNLTDLTLIGPSIQKLCTVMTAVPRMEAFVHEISQLVQVDLEDIVPTVKTWKDQMAEFHQVKHFTTQLKLVLIDRPFTRGEDPEEDSLHFYLSCVSELVYLEKQWLQKSESYEKAEEMLEKRPDVLLHRIIQHFQYLFDVKTLQGVLPKLNAIYLFVKEVNMFLSAIRSELGFDPTANASRCFEAILELLQSKKKKTKGTKSVSPEVNYVVTKDKPIFGVQQVREMHMILKESQEELGAETIQDIVPRIKRLMIMLTQ